MSQSSCVPPAARAYRAREDTFGRIAHALASAQQRYTAKEIRWGSEIPADGKVVWTAPVGEQLLPFLRSRSRTILPVLAAFAIAGAFIGLNNSAYDGFFQDDELDNLTWAPSLPALTFVQGLLTPNFATDNFRPVGQPLAFCP